jgi:hypothetical protein
VNVIHSSFDLAQYIPELAITNVILRCYNPNLSRLFINHIQFPIQCVSIFICISSVVIAKLIESRVGKQVPAMLKIVRGCNQNLPDWRLERELQMVQLSATRCSCIAILWVSLVSSAAITLCVASQRVFIIVVAVVYFVIDSVRKLLDTPSYCSRCLECLQMFKALGRVRVSIDTNVCIQVAVSTPPPPSNQFDPIYNLIHFYVNWLLLSLSVMLCKKFPHQPISEVHHNLLYLNMLEAVVRFTF